MGGEEEHLQQVPAVSIHYCHGLAEWQRPGTSLCHSRRQSKPCHHSASPLSGLVASLCKSHAMHKCHDRLLAQRISTIPLLTVSSRLALQVKLGVLKTNKPLTLYDHPDGSYTTCMAARRDGNAVLSGHADGSLHTFNFDDGTTPAGTAKFAQHSCPPAAMSWGAQAALVTGNDCKVPCQICRGSSACLQAPKSVCIAPFAFAPRGSLILAAPANLHCGLLFPECS